MIAPYYQENKPRLKLYHGDCLEIMPKMRPKSVDLVNTDPPYNTGKEYATHFDKMPWPEYWRWYAAVFSQVFRLLTDNSLAYVSCLDRQSDRIKRTLTKVGFRWIQTLIWYGPNMVGGTTSFRMPWTQLHEPILLFVKGKRPRMISSPQGYNTHDVFVIARPQRNYRDGRYHPTQKPVKLYEHIINRSPGKVTFDPFVGVGTTLVACKKLYRRAIGIEIAKPYCDRAKKTLKATNLHFQLTSKV